MALRVLNVLTRGIGELSRTQPGFFRGVKFARRRGPWWRWQKKAVTTPESESVEASLYKDDIPETVLLNREKHLPDKTESPFKEARRQCVLCRHNITPNYKNVRLLSQFVSGFSGIVYDRHITGLCSFRQTQVVSEIHKSRLAGLMPHTYKHPHFQRDPRLFDPAKPIRPHPYF